MGATLFLVLAVLSCFLTLLLFLPPRSYGPLQLFYFLVTFLWGEFALLNILVQAFTLPLWASSGMLLESTRGSLGIVLMLISWGGLFVYHLLGYRVASILEASLESGLGSDHRTTLPAHLQGSLPQLSLFGWLKPFVLKPKQSQIIKDIAYGLDDEFNTLDMYLPEQGDGPWPVLLYIHGGAFFMGEKQQQGRLLYDRMPREGWAVVSINYRLGPKHRMPSMIEDTKQAIHWIRTKGSEHDLDPEMIVAAGESAGGFLATMAALTPNDPFFQRGFESTDTQVQGCVCLYGPNDLLGLHGSFDAQEYQKLNTKYVMPTSATEDEQLWQRCSPMYRLNQNVPPIFILGGGHDCLVSASETRQLTSAMQKHSSNQVVSAILPFTTHAFDQIRSSRSIPSVESVCRFACWLRNSRFNETSEHIS